MPVRFKKNDRDDTWSITGPTEQIAPLGHVMGVKTRAGDTKYVQVVSKSREFNGRDYTGEGSDYIECLCQFASFNWMPRDYDPSSDGLYWEAPTSDATDDDIPF